MRTYVVDPVHQVLGRRSGAMKQFNQIPMLRSAQRFEYVIDLGIDAKRIADENLETKRIECE